MKTQQTNTETYTIYRSLDGEELIPAIELDSDEIELLSGDNAEGHFRADLCAELKHLGEVGVYAILY